MSVLKESLDNLSFSEGISNQWNNFKLKWAEQTAGFDIFDLTDSRGGKLKIGDDADYLQLFMIMADTVYTPETEFKPLIFAADIGGNRLFARYYTDEEREQFKYGYVALGHAAKELPESAINEGISFFAEIMLEKAAEEGFEKEARKAARGMPDDVKAAWESLIDEKPEFLKTDLYAFQLLKLYSWGFKTVNSNGESDTDFHFVRAKRPQPRGASRH